MKAIILSHERVPEGDDAPEIHRFGFLLDDGQSIPRPRVVSLRTARVLVGELPAVDAFVKMLAAIVQTDPVDYNTLPGQVFVDDDPTRPDAEPLQP
jgi:hypothetical protein